MSFAVFVIIQKTEILIEIRSYLTSCCKNKLHLVSVLMPLLNYEIWYDKIFQEYKKLARTGLKKPEE